MYVVENIPLSSYTLSWNVDDDNGEEEDRQWVEMGGGQGKEIVA